MAPFDPQAVVGGRRPGHVPRSLVLGVAACSVIAVAALAAVAAAGTFSAGIGLALALLPIPLLLAGVLYLDQLEPEPPGRLVFLFTWGAAAAALIGLAGAVAGRPLITTPPLRSEGFAASSPGLLVGVAIAEEVLKGAIVVGLLVARRQEIDGATDGLVYGSMAGLGFALVESFYYYTQALHHGLGDVASTFALRGAVSPVCQALFTSVVGVAVAYAAMSGRTRGRLAIGVGWAAAVGLHWLWNYALTAGFGTLALTYAVLAGVLVIMIGAVVADRRRTIVLIGRYLPQYAEGGIVGPADVTMLSSLWERHQARQWARLHAGAGGRRDMAGYQLAASELGLLHRRADRDLIDAATFAGRRDSLLAGMQAAASDLLGRLANPPRPPWAEGSTSCFRPSSPARPPLPETGRPDQ